MTREEAINEINKVFTSAYANYIVTALTEGATVSDIQHRWGRAYEAGVKDGLEQEPCEDAVSRKAVRDTIFAECAGTKLDIDFAKVLLLQRAIKALPPVTPQEPNTWSLDDAREDFMHDVYNALDFLPTNEEANRIIDIFDRVTSGIGQEPKKGHWIEKWDSDHLVILAYECSECGMMMNVNTFHYCPNCRADMREVKE